MKEAEIDIAAAFGAELLSQERFSIYIPDKDRNGKRVEQGKWIDEALRLLSSINGGATAMPPVKGAWLNEDTGKLVSEEPVIVYSYIDPDDFPNRLGEVVEFAKRLGRETNQGEVAFEFNGGFYLLDQFEQPEK
jgi:hypothetical protein